MSRITTLVYDDVVDVPQDVRALVGVDRFGSLLYQRRRLWEHVAEAARHAGFTQRIHLREPADRVALAEEIARSPGVTRYVYLTADVACPSDAHLARHLAKLSYGEVDLVVQPQVTSPDSALACLSAEALRRLLSCRSPAQRRDWFGDRSPELEALPADGLACLGSAEQLVRFLADTFYTRAFNEIRAAGRTITKRSADRRKMKREHDYWYQLPPALQRFVVQPFDYQEDATGASYRLERLGVPDFAVLWVHGTEAVDEAVFDRFLDAVFDWFAERPTRPVSPDEARERAEALYRTKLDERLRDLLQTSTGQELDRLIAAGTPHGGGLREVVARYGELLDSEWKARPPVEPLAVMHGDLCFSNVLFDKRSGMVRFIDPRGAESPDELYSDPHYDLAKLSHSVLGGYDFINNELFDVILDSDLRLQLRLDRPEPGPREAAFTKRLTAAGFDPVRIRLYEASLFLSMLPLHAERPRKLAAFVLTAIAILDEVSAARSRGASLGRWLAG